MTPLRRRLQSLESRISSDRPKVIFIMPYVVPSEPLSGLSATFQGNVYTFDGSDLDGLLIDAQSFIEASMTSQCEVLSVTILH